MTAYLTPLLFVSLSLIKNWKSSQVIAICKLPVIILLWWVILQIKKAQFCVSLLQVFITAENHGRIMYLRMYLKIMGVSCIYECINFEVRICDKTCNFVGLFRFPSQTKDKFENLIQDLNLDFAHIVNKSLSLIVELGDFNERMQCRYQNFTRRQSWHFQSV